MPSLGTTRKCQRVEQAEALSAEHDLEADREVVSREIRGASAVKSIPDRQQRPEIAVEKFGRIA